jgi:hypothetical protein
MNYRQSLTLTTLNADLRVLSLYVLKMVVHRNRSWHTMNEYQLGSELSIGFCRSCVILGTGKGVTDLEEKRAALEAIVEHICPGRNAEAGPSDAAYPSCTDSLRSRMLFLKMLLNEIRCHDAYNDAQLPD